jgi:L-asparagine transporter-like permease
VRPSPRTIARDEAGNGYRGAVSDDKGGNGEDTKERLDRELIELLNELRVALPGVQVLLAFMLTLPFTQRFGQLSSLQKGTFVVALLSTSCAIVFFMTPTSYHRLRWREGDKEQILTTSNRLSIAGIALMGLGLVAVVFLIMDVLDSTPTAVAVGLVFAVLIASLWFALPLIRRKLQASAGEGGS